MPTRRALLRTGGVVATAGTLAPWWLESNPAAAQTGTSAQPAASTRLPDRPAPAIGSVIQAPRTTLIDGQVLEPGYWRGKVLLIQLWATWCPFCRKQNPLLDRLWRARRQDGLELLGLSIDEKPDVINRYVAEHGYRFPVARFDSAWWAVIGRPKGLPILWVVGRDARLKQIEVGEMFPEDIELLERWI
jgi:thiol-disulfide isomerase/thioredoxin